MYEAANYQQTEESPSIPREERGLAAGLSLARRALRMIRRDQPAIDEEHLEALGVPSLQQHALRAIVESIDKPAAANLAAGNLLYQIDRQLKDEEIEAMPGGPAHRFIEVVSEATPISPQRAAGLLRYPDPQHVLREK